MTRRAHTLKRHANPFAGESPDVGERKAIEDETNSRPTEPFPPPAESETELLPFGPPVPEDEESDEPERGDTTAIGLATRRFPTASQRIRLRMNEGRIVHVATGILTLDANTRGGLIAGRLTIIGGAPDAGKTSLAVQFAHALACNGYAVAIHCADEDAEGIQFRIGQQIGLSLEDLEDGAEQALSSLADYFDSMPAFLIVDQDEDGATVEETANVLVAAARAHGSRGLVLVVDSIQTARARAAEDAPSIRERITAITTELKRFAKKTGALVIATCELSRAAYRSRNAKDRVEDMAAFKESGAVEYAMNTGLVLRPVPDSEDEIDVSIPKNKRGRRVPLRLQRDPERCLYVETPLPPDEDGDADKRAALEAKILAHVRANPGVGVTVVRKAMRENSAHVSHAIELLVSQGKLVREKGPRGGARLYVPTTDEGPSNVH